MTEKEIARRFIESQFSRTDAEMTEESKACDNYGNTLPPENDTSIEVTDEIWEEFIEKVTEEYRESWHEGLAGDWECFSEGKYEDEAGISSADVVSII